MDADLTGAPPAAPAQPPLGDAEAADTRAAELEARLAAALSDAEKLRDEFLRARAEMENVRRRGAEDVSKAHKFGVESFAAALLLVAYLYPGVQVSSFGAALIAALVLGLVNAVIRPLLVILTLPVTLLTLGLFLFVINALMFWLAASVVGGFAVNGFVGALIGSLRLRAAFHGIDAPFGRRIEHRSLALFAEHCMHAARDPAGLHLYRRRIRRHALGLHFETVGARNQVAPMK